MIYRLIYVSAASDDFQEASIPEILEASRRNNGRDGITGVLLYANQSFLQVLEGREATVEAAFTRIERDPRHGSVVRLRADRTAARSFPAWSMGWHNCNPGDEIDGLLRRITDRSDLRGIAHNDTPEIEWLLDAFASRKLGSAA